MFFKKVQVPDSSIRSMFTIHPVVSCSELSNSLPHYHPRYLCFCLLVQKSLLNSDVQCTFTFNDTSPLPRLLVFIYSLPVQQTPSYLPYPLPDQNETPRPSFSDSCHSLSQPRIATEDTQVLHISCMSEFLHARQPTLLHAPFFTSSCGRNFEDTTCVFLQSIEEEWYFFGPICNMWSFFFVENEYLKSDQFYKTNAP